MIRTESQRVRIVLEMRPRLSTTSGKVLSREKISTVHCADISWECLHGGPHCYHHHCSHTTRSCVLVKSINVDLAMPMFTYFSIVCGHIYAHAEVVWRHLPQRYLKSEQMIKYGLLFGPNWKAELKAIFLPMVNSISTLFWIQFYAFFNSIVIF